MELFFIFIIVCLIFLGFISFVINLYRNLDDEGRKEFWIGFLEGASKSRNKSDRSRGEYDSDGGKYVIQYRSGSTWIDGPGSNDEWVAESMFDRFLETDPRGNRRCRLVKKRNGRVVSVLSTN